jgi:ferredoxin
MTKLPDLIRRRRFGVQVPADHDAIQIENTRCPCCTHSLAPVKMSLSMAASALSKRSLRSLKTDTRRCYLCGYLVCIDCWRAEYMESSVGRVAAIVVCTRCHACVKACDYSEVYAPGQEHTRGPPKVVEDQPNDSRAALLTDFLAASLLNPSASSADRAAVHSVVRMLLRQSESGTDSENDGSIYYDSDSDSDNQQDDEVAVMELSNYLNDENRLPELAACTLANAERRGYVVDLPDDPETTVPSSVIPSHDSTRLQVVSDKGLLRLAYSSHHWTPRMNHSTTRATSAT